MPTLQVERAKESLRNDFVVISSDLFAHNCWRRFGRVGGAFALFRQSADDNLPRSFLLNTLVWITHPSLDAYLPLVLTVFIYQEQHIDRIDDVSALRKGWVQTCLLELSKQQ